MLFRSVKGELDEFYKNELSERKMLGFPPYTRLLRLVFRSRLQNAALIAVNGAYSILKHKATDGVEILGPAECPLEMVSANYRMQLLLRAENITPLQKIVSDFIWGYKSPANVYIEVDVDPVNLL